MSIEVEVLSEIYNIMKQYVPSKDRQECADNIMSIMVDLLSDDELKDFSGTDASLGRAFKEYAGEFEEDDYNEDYED